MTTTHAVSFEHGTVAHLAVLPDSIAKRFDQGKGFHVYTSCGLTKWAEPAKDDLPLCERCAKGITRATTAGEYRRLNAPKRKAGGLL